MDINSNEGAFMMATKVQQWGNSLGIRIPRQVANKLGITKGSMLELITDEDKIILKPVKDSPTLEELVSKITDENRHEEMDFGQPKGREQW